MRKLFYIIFSLLFLLTSCSEDETVYDAVKQGSTVPDFVLSDDQGNTLSAESLKGKIYVLTFFHTDCKDCQKELPVLQRAYNMYHGEVEFINVARGESNDDIAAYWNSHDLNMPYYAQADDAIYRKFASQGIPRIYIVDGNGIVRTTFDDSRMADYEQLSNAINTLLDETGQYTILDIVAHTKRYDGEATTRALTSEYYFFNEYAINKLYVYFYDAKKKMLAREMIIDKLSQEEDPPDKIYDISYICNEVRLRVGVYDVFLIANPSHPITGILNEDDFLNTIDTKTYEDGILPNIPESGAVMTNCASDYLNMDYTDLANKRSIINLNIERVMAKVNIGFEKEMYQLKHNDEVYADINLTNYQFVNLNYSFFLFRHTAHLNAFTSPEKYTLEDNFSNTEAIDGTYVIDPFFFHKDGTDDSLERFGTHYYASPYLQMNQGHKGMAPVPAVGNYGSAYILENTCYKDFQMNGYSVGIVFKGAVSPKVVYIYDNNTKKLQQEKRTEYWPLTLFFHNYTFYGSIGALNVGTGMQLDPLKTYTDEELEYYGIKQIKFNMGVYETFYTYWIRHNATAPSNAPMKYGIVRNNFYKLLITGVSGIGTSKINPIPSKYNEAIELTEAAQ